MALGAIATALRSGTGTLNRPVAVIATGAAEWGTSGTATIDYVSFDAGPSGTFRSLANE